MSTKSPLDAVLVTALANIPGTFRSRLIQAYLDLKKNHAEGRDEAAGLAAGKLCEVVLRFLQKKVHGSFTPFGTKINNYADECSRLMKAPATAGNESERVVVPRALVFLYTMRNKRGIGHVGGDVDPNAIDSASMTRTADWIICELVSVLVQRELDRSRGRPSDAVGGLTMTSLTPERYLSSRCFRC